MKHSVRRLFSLTFFLSFVVSNIGCSLGKVQFQLLDANTGLPLSSRPVFFTRGNGSTELGYGFTSLNTDSVGVLSHSGDPGFYDANGKWVPPGTSIDFSLVNGDVLGFEVNGYKPVEVHVGYGSMTVSESIGNLRVFAAIDGSAKEVPFHAGDTIRLHLHQSSPTTAPTGNPPNRYSAGRETRRTRRDAIFSDNTFLHQRFF
ncbi:MAG TPA: hypothetical protein VFC46_15040 [Humisphaera sp.]|nr:hypothetical protein [Humisphaera sp.]